MGRVYRVHACYQALMSFTIVVVQKHADYEGFIIYVVPIKSRCKIVKTKKQVVSFFPIQFCSISHFEFLNIPHSNGCPEHQINFDYCNIMMW